MTFFLFYFYADPPELLMECPKSKAGQIHYEKAGRIGIKVLLLHVCSEDREKKTKKIGMNLKKYETGFFSSEVISLRKYYDNVIKYV